MMRIAGHTMGTPDLTVQQAIDLFANLGLEGIEIICADDYQCGVNLQTSEETLNAIRQRASDRGLILVGLVPYIKDMNSSDRETREKAIADLKRVADMAATLDCPALRVFGGYEVSASESEVASQWLAESLRVVGGYAQEAGIELNIENHMDTMATSAAMTMKIVRAVDLPNVGVLYDQGNLSFMDQETYHTAIPLQWPHINHVHVKDFYWQKEERLAAVVGEGIVPWPQIIASLTNLGYEGFYSLEYERRWFPDQLPPAEIGMKQCAAYLREVQV